MNEGLKPGPDDLGTEGEKTEVRTKESEIKANVDFWKEQGIEVNKGDVRREIEAVPEVEGFDWYIYLPKDLKPWKIKLLMCNQYHQGISPGITLTELKTPRKSEKSYAIAMRYQREPDEDSLGGNSKSPRDWRKKGVSLMTLPEMLVADMRWEKENGDHLGRTMFPTCRYDGGIPIFISEGDEVRLGSCGASDNWPKNGVRKVITKDTPQEILEGYRQGAEKLS